jgi:mono/diheme cytochrome c family protein
MGLTVKKRCPKPRFAMKSLLPLSLVHLSLVLVVLVGAASARAESPAIFAKNVRPLITAHCLDCHGAEVQEAGLRLDTLATDLQNEQTLATWIRVHDKLAKGEMPPKDIARPPQAEIAAAVDGLYQQLHAASRARQQQQGRVVLRRLNGTEYENTIRDLLGVDVALKAMLPDEKMVAGFDNISAALDVSATHQLLYQAAAAKAIAAVIPTHPPMPFSDVRTGKVMVEKGSNFRQTLTRSCKLDGDSLIFYSKLPRYGLCSTASVPTAGRYRATMSIGAVGEAQKAVPAAFLTVGNGREDPALLEFRDIPPGEPQVIEFEVDLERRQAFVINLLSRWDIRAFKQPIEEYTGPGLRVDWIKIEGPIGEFPPASYNTLFAGIPLKARSVAKAESAGTRVPTIAANRSEYSWNADPLVPASANPKKDAERLLRSFLPRAFRRPVSEALQQHFIQRVQEKLDDDYTFADAMTYGYMSILSSPHFLLFDEPGTTASASDGHLSSTRLDDYALANRLSYFLWCTFPDEELLAVAAQGELAQPAVLKAQVERMLHSPKSHRFTKNFVGQWLELRKIDATIPDPHLYGDFDGVLLWSMPRETEGFFEEVLRNDLSLLEFVDSDWSMLNERLATHYGIPGVWGNALRKVKLPAGSHRGGVMTHASVLKVTADGTYTSPILRGKWVLEKIIGQPPAPPPPNIPAIEPDIRGATTIRQQLDKHRNIAVCASCHVHIDPPGFALESFDPIGGYREFYRATSRTPGGIVHLPGYTGRAFYRGPDVELGGQTADGHKFHSIEDYKQILLQDKEQLARSLTEKLLIYATGAEIQFADREIVEQIVSNLKAKNYGLRSLVHEVVQSRLFLNK